MPDEKMIVEISCFEVWRRLSDYVDDDVEPDSRDPEARDSLALRSGGGVERDRGKRGQAGGENRTEPHLAHELQSEAAQREDEAAREER